MTVVGLPYVSMYQEPTHAAVCKDTRGMVEFVMVCFIRYIYVLVCKYILFLCWQILMSVLSILITVI